MERTREQLKAIVRQMYVNTGDMDGYCAESAVRAAVEANIDEVLAEELVEQVAHDIFMEGYREHAWMAGYVRQALRCRRDGDDEGAEAIRRLVC